MAKRGKEIPKFLILLRILDVIETHQGINAGKILQILTDEGFLNSNVEVKTNRRLVNYYLKELEDWGFIQRKGNGRAIKWFPKKRLFNHRCYLNDELKTVLMLLLLGADELVKVTLSGELQGLLQNLSFEKHTVEILTSDISIRYLYGVNLSKLLPSTVKIFRAIQAKKYISLLYKGEKIYRKLLPIGFGLRNGKIYMIALNEAGEKRSFALENISNLSILERTYPGKHFPKPGRFLLFGDKPFVFGLQLGNEFLTDPQFLSFHPLIFFQDGNERNGFTVYMVGFDSGYFASRVAVFRFERLLMPTDDIMQIAKEKKLQLLFPNFDLNNRNIHNERYRSFLKKLKQHLENRLKIVADSEE